MAFRGISDGLERRRTDIGRAQQTTLGPADVAFAFLRELYGPVVARECVIGYATGVLTIRTPARKFSDGLLLRSGELAALVRAKSFALSRIVVG